MNVWKASVKMASIVRDIMLVSRMFVRDIMLVSRVFVLQRYQCVEGFSGDGVYCQRYHVGK